MANNYFVIDIGEKFTKVVDGSLNNNLIEVNAIGKSETLELFYSSETEKNIQDQAEIIKKLIISAKIFTKNVNVIIPTNSTYSQILTMPNLNEKELISAIKYQADQFIPMPIEETNIDIEIIEEYKKENKLLILILAAPKKIVEKVQATVEMAGLVPQFIENELSASARFISLFGKNYAQDDSGIVTVNFGLNNASLSYFSTPNYSLKEVYHFPIGYLLFLKEVRVNANTEEKKSQEIISQFDPKSDNSYPIETIITPLLKEMAQEIKRFLVNKKVTNLYLYNQIFLFPGLVNLLSQHLQMNLLPLNPYDCLKKNTLIDSLKNELIIYLSTLGGNLR